ncbi:hypothetical protein CH274_13285 [Rhodococcus sp. 06-418-5]|uniref:hypothetical protein n=1 Tax=Rhodococcus sp. 06-418-5 TaxID=2022507 RepID=UPI000B9AA091|nr:hypothetical protein [Rhodococcus sp. 06-418-5]OZC80202.1 hypothetical protein CH274_13285 [Rhodococcus sp. 06-418-5]
MNGWQRFWSELWSAEWAADTGVPTAITIVGLAIAYKFFTDQLAHDRELDKQQADRDRKERARERKIGFASAFALEARRIAYNLRDLDHEFNGGRSVDDVGLYIARSRELLNDARRAVDTLAAQVGRGVWSIETRDAIAVIRNRVRVLDRFKEDLSDVRSTPGTVRRHRSFVVNSNTARAATFLDRLATKFDNWDGEQKVPQFQFKPHERRPVAVGQQQRMRQLMDWIKDSSDKFRDELAARFPSGPRP